MCSKQLATVENKHLFYDEFLDEQIAFGIKTRVTIRNILMVMYFMVILVAYYCPSYQYNLYNV